MRFRCIRCGPPPRGLEWEDSIRCPKCGGTGNNHVFQLVDVHFIVLSEDGPIWSDAWGRQYVACMPRRDVLAMHPGDDFSATDMPQAVTCPSCKSTPEYQRIVKELFPQLLIDEQMRKAQGLDWVKGG